MKTALELLKESLTKPQFNKLMAELNREQSDLSYTELTASAALQGAVIWDDTKQGHNYWSRIYHQLRRKEAAKGGMQN